ncbi:glycosyltransferase family 2 protein [Natroniella acetigena]|uniref:glycosyltransferase family 2 protein n=1 Tax=Natroniella acetigena TaxID=52004 RepID=UPI00200B6CDD|nr:glycosyltransferase family 2 protein [Natroniella acetigena]MCK8826611.1 glycosyltransferase family 2 protein [Natroniella acetigena]
MNKLISILIPAYNEADRIADTILAVQSLTEFDLEIIVINDGSSDQTAEVVKPLGVRLIDLEVNQGKGAALNQGLKKATGKIIALLDADLGETAREVEKLLLPVFQQEADLTIAQFPAAKKKGGFGLVKGLARLGLKYLAGFEATEPLSGQRVLTRELIDYLTGFRAGFGVEVAMTIEAIRGGFKVKEIPVRMEHRETGRDLAGFKHRGQQFKDVLAVLCTQVRGGN